MTARKPKQPKHPVLACSYKGDPKRFFGKYKHPADGKWLKIPGGPFSVAVDTRDKAMICAERWYAATFVQQDATLVPRRLLTWPDACDAFIEDVSKRLRGSDATRDEARMKARALRSAEYLSRRPLLQHDEGLALRWLRHFAAQVITKRCGEKGPRDGFTVRNYVKVLREIYRFAQR